MLPVLSVNFRSKGLAGYGLVNILPEIDPLGKDSAKRNYFHTDLPSNPL